MSATVINPITHKRITVGGQRYNALVKASLIDPRDTSTMQYKMPKQTNWVQPPPNPLVYQKGRVATRYAPVDVRTLPPYLQRIAKQESKPTRYSATRGWAIAAPHRTSERRELQAKCGSQCFLLPDAYGRPKYPICDSNCNVDCRGVQSAINRAAQQHAYHVVDLGRQIQQKQCRQ